MSISSSRERESIYDYIPSSYLDGCGLVQRVYKHEPCNSSFSYDKLQDARKNRNNLCPTCQSIGTSQYLTNIVPNEELCISIAEFVRNFKFEDMESSYDLAFHLYEGKEFESAIKICKRALNFQIIDQTSSKNFKDLIDYALGEIKIKLGININEKNIKKLLAKIDSYRKKLKKMKNPDEINQIKKDGTNCFISIATEKYNIAKKSIDNGHQEEAIQILKDAVKILEETKEIMKDLDLLTHEILIHDLLKNLDALGELSESLKNFSLAKKSYKKEIKYLEDVVKQNENKSDSILDRKFYKAFLKLSNVYLNIAKGYLSQENEEIRAKEYLIKARNTLEKIKKNDDKVIELLAKINDEIEKVNINLNLDFFINQPY